MERAKSWMAMPLLLITAGIIAVMVLISHGKLPEPYTDNDIKNAQNYGKDVPELMRELVPKEEYEKISMEIGKLRGPISGGNLLTLGTIMQIAASPCGDSMAYLAKQYASDPATQKALTRTNKGFQQPPFAYGYDNPWIANEDATALLNQMLNVFTKWCTFLPEIIGSNDNGLYYIQYFSWFYYRNPAGMEFVQRRDRAGNITPLETGLKFTMDFSDQRGRFLDNKASTGKVAQWVDDPRIEIKDYQKTEASDYKSWNDFFAREIIIDKKTETVPSRPATMPISEYPKRDYIVVSPTDCIMNPLVQLLQKDGTLVRNYINNPLQEDVVLDVKNIPVSLMDLLGNAPEELKEKFIGGTGLSCVLMPNTYHHFHSPVNGTVIHAEVVSTEKIKADAKNVRIGTYGYEDFTNWVPSSGNVGQPGTDFSQFQVFQRGVVIIEVKYADLNGMPLTGYVASIPVGLDTIGSVVLDKDIKPGKSLKRGYTRLGNFYYGGSLNILLFSKGLATGAVKTRMGTQITLFKVGHSPPTPK